MQLQRIHHVSINVADLGAALDFYVDTLGLSILHHRPDLGFPGAWLDAGEQEIHLIEVADFAPPAGQHFAFEVTDLATALDELATKNVRVSSPSTMEGICVQAFLTDPTGNLIELNQRVHPHRTGSVSDGSAG